MQPHEVPHSAIGRRVLVRQQYQSTYETHRNGVDAVTGVLLAITHHHEDGTTVQVLTFDQIIELKVDSTGDVIGVDAQGNGIPFP